MIKRLEHILKHNQFIQKIYVVVFSLVFRFIGLFIKKDKHQIIFQSLIGKSYGDSPKILYDAVRTDERFKDYKFIWAFDNPDKFYVEGAEKVNLHSPKFYIEALRSGVWITNVSIERGLKFKPKGTVYLNTWHGVPIKLVGNAQKTRNDYDYSDIDFMCCSSEFEREIFIRDFNVRPETIVKCGMPRNDALYSTTEEEVTILRKKYNIPDGKKVLLYAPTWRDSTDGGKSFQIAPPIDVKYWEEKLGEEYVMLFRMHHLTTEIMGVDFNDFARDASHVAEINELMKISDVLLSDYSAMIFDYSILEKPIIAFAYDLESYAKTRGFYDDLENVLQGSVLRTADEVIHRLNTINWEEEIEKTKRIKSHYIESNGNATKACLDYLCGQTVEKKERQVATV